MFRIGSMPPPHCSSHEPDSVPGTGPSDPRAPGAREAGTVLNPPAAISDWCRDLRKPGHWHPAATDLVVKLLPGLPGWPRDKAFELVDLATERLVRSHEVSASAILPRVWRDEKGLFRSAKALEIGSPPPQGRHRGDAFLEALAQELELCNLWQPIRDRSLDACGTTKAEQLRNILAEHIFRSAPALIRTIDLPKLGDLGDPGGPAAAAPNTTSPASTSWEPSPAKRARPEEAPAGAALGPARQKGLDILVGWIHGSNWASVAGDIAPQFITRLPNWPAGRALEVFGPGFPQPVVYRFGNTQPGQMPVQIWRENNHYCALVNGRREAVPGDGNCFFHATVKAMGRADVLALTGTDVDPNTQAFLMRLELARFVQGNPQEIAQWVDLEQIARSLSAPFKPWQPWNSPSAAQARPQTPPQGTAPAEAAPSNAARLHADAPKRSDALAPPSRHLPDVVRAASASASTSKTDPKSSKVSMLERTAAALHELMALAKTRQHERADSLPLTSEDLEQCAAKYGLAVSPLKRKIKLNGNLNMRGHSILQSWEYKTKGISHRLPDAAFLRNMQAFARSNQGNSLSDQDVIKYALQHEIAISYLRTLIRTNGEFTSFGHALIQRSEDNVNGIRYKNVTARTLLDLQKKARQNRDEHLDLRAEAERLNVRYTTLVKMIRGDGTISILGERKISGSEQTYEALTPDILLEIQDQVARGKSLKDECDKREISINTVLKMMTLDGILRPEGEYFLHSHGLKENRILPNHLTPDDLYEIKDIITHGALRPVEAMVRFSIERNLPYFMIRSCISVHGDFTRTGLQFLEHNTAV